LSLGNSKNSNSKKLRVSNNNNHKCVFLTACQAVPIFVQDIVDARVCKGETVKFECGYSGTPTPDVVWYKNDKLVTNTKNVKVQYLENKTSITVLSATSEDVGTYTCKATSDIGLAVTKAKLYVQGMKHQ